MFKQRVKNQKYRDTEAIKHLRTRIFVYLPEIFEKMIFIVNGYSMMKRLLVVALVATVLYGCGNQNSQNSANNKTDNTETAKATMESSNNSGVSGAKIVYINEDSLLANYGFAKRIRKDLTTKQQEVQADLGSREQNFKNEVASYQRTAGTMTMNVAKATEQQLAVKQRDLQAYSRVRGKELANEQMKMTKKLKDNIQDYLKRYCEKNGYDYVLTYSANGGGVLYGSTKLDVTLDILKGLNKEYADGKTGDIKAEDKKDEKKEEKKDTAKADK